MSERELGCWYLPEEDATQAGWICWRDEQEHITLSLVYGKDTARELLRGLVSREVGIAIEALEASALPESASRPTEHHADAYAETIAGLFSAYVKFASQNTLITVQPLGKPYAVALFLARESARLTARDAVIVFGQADGTYTIHVVFSALQAKRVYQDQKWMSASDRRQYIKHIEGSSLPVAAKDRRDPLVFTGEAVDAVCDHYVFTKKLKTQKESAN
jgi:hypothetical protein